MRELENKSSQQEAVQKKAAVISGKTPEEIIGIATDLMNENNMEEARAILYAFIAQNTANIYIGWMLFIVGNTHFLEKDYRNAALVYMKAYKTNPGGSKAAETLFKLALCFRHLNEDEKCKSTFKKIVSDYHGEFARKASVELKNM
jgi:TolA-binding protein